MLAILAGLLIFLYSVSFGYPFPQQFGKYTRLINNCLTISLYSPDRELSK